MGCSCPKFVNRKTKIFKVVNLDREGRECQRCEIEVTDDSLILYHLKKRVITWPISTLKRYGFEHDVFSFETGRRCPTGKAVYAFKCTKADRLFGALQKSIQEVRRSLSRGSRGESAYSHIEAHPPVSERSRMESIPSSSSCPHTPVTPVPFIRMGEGEQLWNISNILVQDSAGLAQGSQRDASVHGQLNLTESSESPYLNIIAGPPNLSLSDLSLSLPPIDAEQQSLVDDEPLNYITLDLEKGSHSKQSPNSSAGIKYAKIDFEKTSTLVLAGKPFVSDEPCKRFTRHDLKVSGSPQ